MTFSERLIMLIHSIKNNNIEASIREKEINTLNIGLEMFEDEMFIGSVFCCDLSGNQKIVLNNQQKLYTNRLNERFGIATNHEQE